MSASSVGPQHPAAPPPDLPRHRPVHRIVMLGDSVAWTLASALPVPRGVTMVNDAVVGCGVTTLSPYRYFGAVRPLPRRCRHWPPAWARDVRRAHADEAVVLVGRWEVMDRRMRGRWTHIGRPSYDAYLRARLVTALRTAGSTGSRVVALTAPYYFRGPRPGGGRFPEDHPSRVDAFNRILRHAASTTGATVIELGRRMAGGGHRYVESVDGVQLRYDGVHISPQGARWLAPWLLPRLRRA